MSGRSVRTIGVIEAAGTGRRTAAIFREVVQTVLERSTEPPCAFLSFQEECGYLPDSYLSLCKRLGSRRSREWRAAVLRQVADLEAYLERARLGTVGVFRAAINAETLYDLRRRVKKIKIAVLPLSTKRGVRRLVFVRDQLQGYYANDRVRHVGSGSLSVTSSFSQKGFVILMRALARVLQQEGIGEYDLQFVYKFHLFGVRLDRMIATAVRHSRLHPPHGFSVAQPDTAVHRLLAELPSSERTAPIVLVVGNEIGDVLFETLINFYRVGTKETLYGRNLAFVDRRPTLEVLQTIHGSADDIAERDSLNPVATIRAAAYALERWLGVPDAIQRMEAAIGLATQEKRAWSRDGACGSTDAALRSILAAWA